LAPTFERRRVQYGHVQRHTRRRFIGAQDISPVLLAPDRSLVVTVLASATVCRSAVRPSCPEPSADDQRATGGSAFRCNRRSRQAGVVKSSVNDGCQWYLSGSPASIPRLRVRVLASGFSGKRGQLWFRRMATSTVSVGTVAARFISGTISKRTGDADRPGGHCLSRTVARVPRADGHRHVLADGLAPGGTRSKQLVGFRTKQQARRLPKAPTRPQT